jgi:sugar phosphate isomerase/epimerase
MILGVGASTNVQATIDRCKQLDAERVSISCPSLPGFEENGYPDPASLREIKGELEDNGLVVKDASWRLLKWPPLLYRTHSRGGATSPEVLLSRDRRAIDAMARMIEVVGEAGITSVLQIIDIAKPIDTVQAEACWEALIDIYRELMPVAEANGVGIGNHSLHRLLRDGVRERAVAEGVRIEDYGSYMTEGWGGPFLVGTWKELRRLVNAAPSPSNGVTLCTGMDIPGGDVPALVVEFADKVHFCQLRDHSDRWPTGREGPLGEGRVDLPAIIAALRDADYQGILNPEHLGQPRYQGENLEAKAVAYVKSLLASLDNK